MRVIESVDGEVSLRSWRGGRRAVEGGEEIAVGVELARLAAGLRERDERMREKKVESLARGGRERGERGFGEVGDDDGVGVAGEFGV